MQAMADASSLLTIPAAGAPYHTAAYAQRRMPDSPALLALFHDQAPPHERQTSSQNHRERRRKACLRKISAYNGGFRVAEDADDTCASELMRYAKKRLSFADQHGGQLALEREFNARDAPIYCNSAVTYSLPMAPPSYHHNQGDRWRGDAGSLMQRLLRGVLGAGGRGGEDEKSGWAQPELLSVCLVSCSVIGCVALSYARQGSAAGK